MRKKASLLLVFTGLLSLIAVQSCDKDKEHPVPYVMVDHHFNIIHYDLAAPGFSHQFSRSEAGGYRGIIVYRLSTDEFRAYDRACPCDPHNCTVSIKEGDMLRATDPCCGSTFILIDGSVETGDAPAPLKEYRAIFNAGTNRLHITNW